VKLVIVEDSAAVRLQLRKLLAVVPGLEIVAEATSEAGAIETIQRLRPDAVLLDLRLAPGNGLNVLRALKPAAVRCRTIVLSNETDPRYKALCLELGAEAFFDKSLETKAALAHLAEWTRAFTAGRGHAS
jgi:DNA-binding NarL/FixJ family response regulator